MTEDKFWIVWSPTGSRPPSHRHDTERSAVQEAERLARLHQGQEFIVLEAVASRMVDAMQRVTYEHGIPF